jgi:hypothetical protein
MLTHKKTINPISPHALTNPTRPKQTRLMMVTVVASVVSISRLLIMNMVKGICAKMYIRTTAFVFRNGFRLDRDLTTHQYIVVYGKAVAKNMY